MLSFIIQFRYDSEDRLKNLLRGVIYLHSHFKNDSSILIIDQDNNFDLLTKLFAKYEITNTTIHSLRTSGPYHRSKVINQGLNIAKTDLCLIYDCDILIPVHQIKTSILLATHGYDVVYPFTSPQYDIPQSYFPNFELNYDFEKIKQDFSPRKWGAPDDLMLKHGHSGFGMLINKQTAKNLSYFNEDFNGWGYEDNEYLFRLNKFGAKISRAWGPIFHVEHDRTLQNQFALYTSKNCNLYNNIRSLNDNDLIAYYKQRNLI
jgi:predicted glycosyltransferase involved in capsule biosynthesis